MSEEELGRKVAARLSASCELDDRVLARLRSAREGALAVQRLQNGHGRGRLAWHAAAAVLVALLLVTAGDFWNTAGESEVAELDAALLADDLPIDAYLDPDFKAWLERG